MFTTIVNLGSKSKAERIVVMCKSVATGHGRMMIRSRLGDKLEFVEFDPQIQRPALYKEEKKIRSVRNHQIEMIPRLLYTNVVHNKAPSFGYKEQ